MWANIKVTITRWERLFLELQNEFNGDKDKFFSFFTTTDTSTGKKRKATESTEKFRPLRLVVEAIPHRDKDLAAEKMQEHFQENSIFSKDTPNWLLGLCPAPVPVSCNPESAVGKTQTGGQTRHGGSSSNRGRCGGGKRQLGHATDETRRKLKLAM
ncbi:hypothetical protein B0H10DRAFT_2197372 [Mycena sp. CBHHK59/15]|nr:hypothetical protein B0H10DRAFT_2197372 [Mycena sp. CBHHK59/15]